MGNTKSRRNKYEKTRAKPTRTASDEPPVQDCSSTTPSPNESGPLFASPIHINAVNEQVVDVQDCHCRDCEDNDTLLTPEGERYHTFSSKCGENVIIKSGGTVARRKHACKIEKHGVVITEQPLRVNERFEIRLDAIVNTWSRGLELGITCNPSDDFKFPASMTDYEDELTFMWTENHVLKNGESVLEFKEEFHCTEGDTLGIMVTDQGMLHFYTNGNKMEETLDLKSHGLQDSSKVYAVVDIFGEARQVSVCAIGYVTENLSLDDVSRRKLTDEEYKDSRAVMEQMRCLMRSMKTVANYDMYQAAELVRLYLLKPAKICRDEQSRQKYGNHLANLGAASQLKRLLDLLMRVKDPDQDDWVARDVVRSACWNYSDYSLKMCRALAQCGFLCDMLSDLGRYQSTFTDDKNQYRLVHSAVSVLHNCSKATDNLHFYQDLKAIERIAPYLKVSDTQIAMLALLTLSNIIEEDEEDQVEADISVIAFLVELLQGAMDQPSRRYKNFTVLELVDGLGNIAVNTINKIRIVDKGATPLLVKLMSSEQPIEQECAIKALSVIAKLDVNSKKIIETSDALEVLQNLARGQDKNVKGAAERALAVILSQKQSGQITKTIRSEDASNYPIKEQESCKYQELCARLKKLMELPDECFDPRHDRCYCNSCLIARGDDPYYRRGKPPKLYGVPIGWCRFALRVEARANALNVFKNWHVGYHGTVLNSVRPILDCGSLLMPGDTAMGGKRLGERSGHFSDDNKPDGFDTKQVFLSPSIRYSGLNVYALPTRYVDNVTKQTYWARAVFQVFINPNSYRVGPQTVGAKMPIDPKFSNQELEWFTKQRGCIIIYGLLINLELAAV
ncbi:neuralized-like protein 4 [Ptychodera flava]|uniref:neuralized-like protein 4 n=1 Tax=Ptychodera flava TaxID=63121 RepID=UPI00396A346E